MRTCLCIAVMLLILFEAMPPPDAAAAALCDCSQPAAMWRTESQIAVDTEHRPTCTEQVRNDCEDQSSEPFRACEGKQWGDYAACQVRVFAEYEECVEQAEQAEAVYSECTDKAMATYFSCWDESECEACWREREACVESAGMTPAVWDCPQHCPCSPDCEWRECPFPEECTLRTCTFRPCTPDLCVRQACEDIAPIVCEAPPGWDDLPENVRHDIEQANFNDWYAKANDKERLTLLNAYLKMKAADIWQFVDAPAAHAGDDSVGIGMFEFDTSDTNAFHDYVLAMQGFSTDESKKLLWGFREDVDRYSLHIKRFPGWAKSSRIQVHVDPYGYNVSSTSFWGRIRNMILHAWQYLTKGEQDVDDICRGLWDQGFRLARR